MKQFKTIFTFEYLGYVRNKLFTGLTVAVILIMGIVLFYPRFNDGKAINMGSIGVSFAQNIAIKSEIDYDLDAIKDFITQGIEDAQITVSDKSDEELFLFV